MKNRYLLVLLIISHLELFSSSSSNEDPSLSLKETKLLPQLQQVVIDYLDCGDNWTEGKVLSGHRNKVNSLSISNDGSILVSGSDDQTVKIWNFNTGNLIKNLDFTNNKYFFNDKYVGNCDSIINEYANINRIHCVSISKDKKYIAILNSACLISVYALELDKYLVENINFEEDLKSFSKDNSIIGHYINKPFQDFKDAPHFISFSPDNKFILYFNSFGLYKVLDIKSFRWIDEINAENITKFFQTQFYQEEKNKKFFEKDCFCVYFNNFFKYNINWKISLGNCFMIYPHFGFSQNNKNLIAYSNQTKNLLIYHNNVHSVFHVLSEEEIKQTFEIKTDESITTFVLSPDGKYLVAAIGNDIKIWNNNYQHLLSNKNN